MELDEITQLPGVVRGCFKDVTREDLSHEIHANFWRRGESVLIRLPAIAHPRLSPHCSGPWFNVLREDGSQFGTACIHVLEVQD